MTIIVFFISLLLTLFFLNDKFSKAVRVMAFAEGESENSARKSFILMVLIAIAWTIFFAIV